MSLPWGCPPAPRPRPDHAAADLSPIPRRPRAAAAPLPWRGAWTQSHTAPAARPSFGLRWLDTALPGTRRQGEKLRQAADTPKSPVSPGTQSHTAPAASRGRSTPLERRLAAVPYRAGRQAKLWTAGGSTPLCPGPGARGKSCVKPQTLQRVPCPPGLSPIPRRPRAAAAPLLWRDAWPQSHTAPAARPSFGLPVARHRFARDPAPGGKAASSRRHSKESRVPRDSVPYRADREPRPLHSPGETPGPRRALEPTASPAPLGPPGLRPPAVTNIRQVA